MPGGRSSWLMRVDRLVHGAQHLLRVLPAAQQHRPLDRVDRAARAPPPRAAACTPRPPARRCAPGSACRRSPRTTVFSMSRGRLQVAAAAHDQLGLAELQVAARRRAVRRRDRVDQVLQREAGVAQPARVGEHVVLLLEAAEADHVGDAGRAHQVLRDDPVLPAAQLAGRVAVALQRVLVDLPDRRVVRARGAAVMPSGTSASGSRSATCWRAQ